MGACINDCVWHVVVWQVGISWITIERELQDMNPGQLELVTQRGHIRRDQPQVFGNER